MVKLTKELIETLRDSETVKTLTTTDEAGNPHTVFKDTMTALDEESLAYIELIETSHTYKNMLRNYWNKKSVSITLYNEKRGIFYQIKGKPYKWVIDEPLWDQFLDKVWSMLPDADPSGVWIIKPKEIIDQSYEIRRMQEADRSPNSLFWYRYLGPRS
ncbi:MAG: pyridoxamine 5'-phosphate oxidase family protein [Thermodesulfobacteriota bacterium]|nr:pyridoxamine 5'-phosphate oxidase family protein [Thermodesulfobacteriota bacterium]